MITYPKTMLETGESKSFIGNLPARIPTTETFNLELFLVPSDIYRRVLKITYDFPLQATNGLGRFNNWISTTQTSPFVSDLPAFGMAPGQTLELRIEFPTRTIAMANLLNQVTVDTLLKLRADNDTIFQGMTTRFRKNYDRGSGNTDIELESPRVIRVLATDFRIP